MKAKSLVLDARRYYSPGVVAPPASLEDMTRFRNNGTFTAITQTKLASGLWVYGFDGATSLINCGADYSLSSYLKPHGFALEAWVYANSDGENDEGRIFSKATGYELWIDTQAADGCLIETWIDHVTTDANAITSGRIRIGTWGHVVAVYNRLGTFRIEIYLNGVLMALGTDTAGVGGLSDDRQQTLYLGNNAATTRTFDGNQVYYRIHYYPPLAGQVASFFEEGKGWFGA